MGHATSIGSADRPSTGGARTFTCTTRSNDSWGKALCGTQPAKTLGRSAPDSTGRSGNQGAPTLQTECRWQRKIATSRWKLDRSTLEPAVECDYV
jgi:hypothetical protein